MKFHRIRRIGRAVERIELQRQLAIAEVLVEEVSRPKQRPPAAVARILRKAPVVADDAARLPALVIAAETGTGGNADCPVKDNAGLHPGVQHACREQAAHRATFEYESAFHRRDAPFVRGQSLDGWNPSGTGPPPPGTGPRTGGQSPTESLNQARAPSRSEKAPSSWASKALPSQMPNCGDGS